MSSHHEGPIEGRGTTIFQHPLAYLIGLEGVALMRAFAGAYDEDFTRARLAEVRGLLDEADVLGDGAHVRPRSAGDGYQIWAPSYDGPGNSIFGYEEAITHPILDGLPAGVAVDAACGTGRLPAYLHGLGHAVRGFDTSTGMLDVARQKLPTACSRPSSCGTPARVGRLESGLCASD